jgi:hypothetical protein
MIRTTITPNTQTVFFDIPTNYVGKELEVIVFAKNEVEQTNDQPKKIRLSGLKGKLSKETASQMQKEIAESRNEWEERIKKQY